MVTSVCEGLGLGLPDDLMPANPSNPRGFYESIAICRAHEALLGELGSAWFDVQELPADWLQHPSVDRCRAAVTDVIAGMNQQTVAHVIKDPRLCVLAPLWRGVAESLGLQIQVLIPIRHPADVAMSLDRRDQINPLIGLVLWWRHVTAAVQFAADHPNAVLAYDATLHEPRLLYDALKDQLQLPLSDWDQAMERECLGRVADDLRHHRGDRADFAGHRYFLDRCEGLHDALLERKAIDRTFTQPETPAAVQRVCTWFPEWRRLFDRYTDLRTPQPGAEAGS